MILHFLKTPICTNFDEERALKKRNFLVEIFQKVPKKSFWPVFSKICLGRREFRHIRVLIVVWESSENHLVDLKKIDKNFNFFFLENPPLPLENFLDQRLRVVFEMPILVENLGNSSVLLFENGQKKFTHEITEL